MPGGKDEFVSRSAPMRGDSSLFVCAVGIMAFIAAATFLTSVLFAQDAVPVTGWPDKGGQKIDKLMVNFMGENNVPGASLSIAKNGFLLYSKGSGFSNLENREEVTPQSLFRICSISKCITAVTVMKLAEEDKLTLDEKAFAILGYTPFLDPGREIDTRINDITILNLLQHAAGWDLSKTFDPLSRERSIAKEMKVRSPAAADDIIKYMMGKPLQYEPGTRYAYSNFGYLVLGKIIEKRTGVPYEEAVRTGVLDPLNICDLKVGHTELQNKDPNEVIYYDSEKRTVTEKASDGTTVEVPYPYWKPRLQEFASVGGWIGTSHDLVKFASEFQSARRCRILKERTVKKMFELPENVLWLDEKGNKITRYSYCCGWKIKEIEKNRFDIWHMGSLSGSSAAVAILHDGYVYAVLFNTRNNQKGEKLPHKFCPILTGAIRSAGRWAHYRKLDGSKQGLRKSRKKIR